MKQTLFIIVVVGLVLTGCGNRQEKSKDIMKTVTNGEIPKISDFPLGNENTGYAQYFSGRSWLAPLTEMSELNVPISNVTFEPACRNNWHSHTGGQILVAVGGVGYYQERGKPAVRMMPGDVIEIAPDLEHWHGAAPDTWFSHLAIACNPQTNQNIWLNPVSDKEYLEAVKREELK
ncbi:MAG: cupin domain-containing protein [Bacteroidales bacterium]|nr:cupin domain-containing protein [Bacteroidales bacterium]